MPAIASGRVRTTIAVDPEVYDAFADMAAASGVSMSRCIGDWLRDTAEAAQITTVKLREVRNAPQDALQAFIRDGMVPEMLRVMDPASSVGMRRRGSAAQPHSGAARSVAALPSPPASNTGGKVPQNTTRRPKP